MDQRPSSERFLRALLVLIVAMLLLSTVVYLIGLAGVLGMPNTVVPGRTTPLP